MIARINFEYLCGETDSFLMEGADLEAILARSKEELVSRGGRNPWSEILDEGEDR